MVHLSENTKRLKVKHVAIRSRDALLEETHNLTDVCLLRLPSCAPTEYGHRLQGISQLAADVAANLGPETTLITLGEVIDLVQIHASVASSLRYQHWIAIKRSSQRTIKESFTLPQYHFGALIHTGYKSSLQHAKTRIRYTYCPVCDKTTKDYGGKKHTYHEYGTLMSDVWRDIACDLDGDLTPIINRFADLFGIEHYQEIRVLDLRPLGLKRIPVEPVKHALSKSQESNELFRTSTNKLILGDCLERLREIPDESVDFVFADPPYNLGKKYVNYTDNLEITDFFKWCDEWIIELARVLRSGRTCAILNIPLWAIRHFLQMEKILNFQSWIVWDALSFPVRFIMPAHYTILCFSKGKPRELPGLTGEAGRTEVSNVTDTFKSLSPLAEGFCLRSLCVKTRRKMQVDDRGPLTDLWGDIHRLKHNTRRVDHPCQLPPQLMYRLISLFTKPDEIVLDCFNGSGTTTLAAHQIGRRYIGIEISEEYHNLAQARHEEILKGLDPFRKTYRLLTAKNSPVSRMPKRKYEISKKKLQLEIKRIAENLRRLPTRDEVVRYSKYPIKYYDEYFSSWGEVCAAARTTGMTEAHVKEEDKFKAKQLTLEIY
ncbi:MAG: DNA methyltransferase [Euryarchaeota archaeon]|nr:DNA methyltransferase [Euryarchaeota archaeon]